MMQGRVMKFLWNSQDDFPGVGDSLLLSKRAAGVLSDACRRTI